MTLKGDHMTLTKAELADLLFEKVGFNKREAKDMVESFFEEVRLALSDVAGSVVKTLEESAPRTRRRRTKDRFDVAREALFVPPNRFVLIGRELETAALDLAWNSDRIRVLSFVGSGGSGKTTLVRAWFDRMKHDEYRGARRVLGWSFYSQGSSNTASGDVFFADALGWFGHAGAMPASAWERGELLAKLVKQKRTLLVLDGLEPLQAPPGADEGKLRDPGSRRGPTRIRSRRGMDSAARSKGRPPTSPVRP